MRHQGCFSNGFIKRSYSPLIRHLLCTIGVCMSSSPPPSEGPEGGGGEKKVWRFHCPDGLAPDFTITTGVDDDLFVGDAIDIFNAKDPRFGHDIISVGVLCGKAMRLGADLMYFSFPESERAKSFVVVRRDKAPEASLKVSMAAIDGDGDPSA